MEASEAARVGACAEMTTPRELSNSSSSLKLVICVIVACCVHLPDPSAACNVKHLVQSA